MRFKPRPESSTLTTRLRSHLLMGREWNIITIRTKETVYTKMHKSNWRFRYNSRSVVKYSWYASWTDPGLTLLEPLKRSVSWDSKWRRLSPSRGVVGMTGPFGGGGVCSSSLGGSEDAAGCSRRVVVTLTCQQFRQFRSSGLVSAFERTFKQHLVSYSIVS